MAQSEGKSVLTALVLGVAVGFAAGILTAPKSGAETREDLRKAADKLKKDLEVRLADAKEDLNAAIEQATVKARDLSQKGKKELDDLLVTARAAQAKAKDVLSAVKSGEADDKDLQVALSDAKTAKNHLVNFLRRPQQ